MTKPISFTHILNPIVKPPEHELSIAQAVTFESIKRAKAVFQSEGFGELEFICAIYPEDADALPKLGEKVTFLENSLQDLVEDRSAPKLPLISEIVERSVENSTGDYLIYSNIDIALMPFFYTAVEDLLNSGWDNLLINRRTIHPSATDPEAILGMYSLVGEPHPGYDCFVFPKEMAQQIDLGELVLGLAGYDWVLALNLWYRSKRNYTFKDAHLTFHIGDDQKWRSKAMGRFQEANYAAMQEPIAKLRREFGDHQNLLWPRPSAPKRSFLRRGLNRVGRLLADL